MKGPIRQFTYVSFEDVFGGEQFVLTLDNVSYTHTFPLPLRRSVSTELKHLADRICDADHYHQTGIRAAAELGGLTLWPTSARETPEFACSVTAPFPVLIESVAR